MGATYFGVIRSALLQPLQLAAGGRQTSCSQGHFCTWGGLPGLLLSRLGPRAVSGRGSREAGGATGTPGSQLSPHSRRKLSWPSSCPSAPPEEGPLLRPLPFRGLFLSSHSHCPGGALPAPWRDRHPWLVRECLVRLLPQGAQGQEYSANLSSAAYPALVKKVKKRDDQRCHFVSFEHPGVSLYPSNFTSSSNSPSSSSLPTLLCLS